MEIGANRIPLTAKEAEGVEQLLDQYPGESATLTRRDPGETGPLLVTIGGEEYEIAKNGKSKKREGK
jgi:hypothetical protein